MIGRTLSHYEVTAKLGEGGMGEVWRARDTRLDREVALKVLPEEMASDPERLERFEREAKAIATLNHPNIVTIHAVEEVEGIHLLVMELVGGKSLDELLPSDGFEPGRCFALAAQIADALAAAHDRGITHRDLKPANVMVTLDDRVKVLDFGLAKLAREQAQEEQQTELLTQAGMILGTVPYMSPEQVQAKPIDYRSDIFSLGIMLYEMATGTRPFQGDNPASVISAVLKDRPPSVTEVKQDLPNHLGRVVGRCLEKDPRRRYQSARDIQLELEGLGKELESAQSSGVSIDAQHSTGGRPVGRERWVWMLAVGVLLTALGAALLRPAPPVARSTSLVIPLPDSGRLLPDHPPAVSPDGTTIAYSVREGPDTSIYIHGLDSFDSAPVPGTRNGKAPFFSPDGRWIGFTVGGQLFKVPVQGGTPILLEQGGFWEPSTHWHSDDEILLGGDAGDRYNGLLAVATDGSGSTQLTSVDEAAGEISHESPHRLGDGTILFAVQTAEGKRMARYRPSSGEWSYLSLEAEPPAVLVSGRWLVFQSRTSLMAVEWADRGGPIGEPVEIHSGVAPGEWAISPSGVVAYLFSQERGSRVVAVDRQGRLEVLLTTVRNYSWPRISPDGKRLVVGYEAAAQSGLWIHELESGRSFPLDAPGSNGEPAWTPDGRRVAYSSYVGGSGGDIHWQLADGSGSSEELYSADFGAWPTAFSPDGSELALYGVGGGEDAIWIASVPDASGKPASGRRAIDGPGVQRAGAFSPDGNWIAYSSSESRRNEIYLRPYPDLDSRRHIVSREGGVDPQWSATGRELFYRNGDAVVVVDISADSESVVGVPRELFRGHFHFQRNGDQSFDVFPDGQRFLMIEPTPESRRELRVITRALAGLEP